MHGSPEQPINGKQEKRKLSSDPVFLFVFPPPISFGSLNSLGDEHDAPLGTAPKPAFVIFLRRTVAPQPIRDLCLSLGYKCPGLKDASL